MHRFTIATLTPAFLIALAVWLGGLWPWMALGYMTLLVFAMDRLIASESDMQAPDTEFPAADTLLKSLATLHFILLALCLYAALNLTGPQLALTLICTGLVFGQISHPVAHELIHKHSKLMRLLGRLIYSSLLVGHHASAHLRVHHVHVGSDKDPNSPRAGEGFYRYALRATRQSFILGLREENRARKASAPLWTHPYALYLGIGLSMFVLFAGFAGAIGAGVFCVVALHAQMQILMSDYVQHYGLRRQTMPDGSLEPVGPQHSWNAPHWFSSAMMLNATRHSDHHVNPKKAFPSLELKPVEMPMMPYPLPLMGTIALMPSVWRRLMDRRVGRWTRRPWQKDETNSQDQATLAVSKHAQTHSDSFANLAKSGPGAG
ncbi:MAG: alkane 1-monooxygenase [Pseudomonadota bacterium]